MIAFEVDGYDEEYREMGECGARVVALQPGLATMSTCSLEYPHEGPHNWHPDYVDPDEDDEDDQEKTDG